MALYLTDKMSSAVPTNSSPGWDCILLRSVAGIRAFSSTICRSTPRHSRKPFLVSRELLQESVPAEGY